MNKNEFKRFLSDSEIVYLDGATGSNLMKAGMPAGVCPEKWIIDNPQAIIDLQRRYVEAGSNIVYAPTFGGNRVKLEEYGLSDDLVSINTKLVSLSKEAVGDKAFVAGDLTMTGKQLKPAGPMEFEELIDIYKEQITVLKKAGVDLLVVETMMSLQETRAAAIAAMEVDSDLPILATLTFENDGRTLFGSDARSAAIALDALHVDAIGANCSTGPEAMSKVIAEMASVTDKPLIAKPNAGLPALDENGKTIYDMDAATFAAEMKAVIDAGASIVGGCCGTDPEFIRLLKKNVDDNTLRPVKEKVKGVGKRFLCSERQSLEFTLDGRFFIVGERINPTGKKKLQAELKEGSLSLVEEYASQQEESGAKVLDINMGLGGIDEKQMMLDAIETVSGVTSLPLCLDSSYIEVLEAGLRRYPGRALINSISCETVKFRPLLDIAKKYGAMFILLPLTDKGLPENEAEREKNIEDALKVIYDEYGFTNEDIVVDGLVATVAAQKEAAKDTLRTIAYCKEHDLATICGLSNISFGLPERMNVNSAFLTMAIFNGLTMAIANPNQDMLVNAAFSSDILMNKPEADEAYIERMEIVKEKNEAELLRKAKELANAGIDPSAPKGGDTPLPNKGDSVAATDELSVVRETVVKGRKRDAAANVQKALDAGFSPEDILNKALMPAIDDVGALFDQGKYFLPQLIAGAEAMKLGIEVIEPLLKKDESGEKLPTVILATVKGDIHDIGKNLVGLMLKNNGFTVVDMGKDVPCEDIINAAKEKSAKIIALSALMTTTMLEMKKVIEEVKNEGLADQVKVMVGGACVTEDYAKEIGADGYSTDAADAVRVAKELGK